MTVPADVAVTGLSELAVRARTDAGQVKHGPPGPGRSLAQILRANVLTRFNAILGARPHAAVTVMPQASPGWTATTAAEGLPAGTLASPAGGVATERADGACAARSASRRGPVT